MSIGFLAMMLFIGFANDGIHPIAAADRHGGLVHHHGKIACVVLANSSSGCRHMPQIRAAIRGWRRSHGDENHIRVRNRGSVVAAESKIRSRFGQQFRQVRLIDGRLAGLQHRDLLLIRVDAGDFVSQKCKTGSSGQPHVAGANDRYIHALNMCPFTTVTEPACSHKSQTGTNFRGAGYGAYSPKAFAILTLERCFL